MGHVRWRRLSQLAIYATHCDVCRRRTCLHESCVRLLRVAHGRWEGAQPLAKASTWCATLKASQDLVSLVSEVCAKLPGLGHVSNLKESCWCSTDTEVCLPASRHLQCMAASPPGVTSPYWGHIYN